MLRNILTAISIAVIISPFSIGCGPIGPQNAVITLFPDQRFQTITGWEAVAQTCKDYSKAYPKYSDRLFDLAVDDIGLNRVRLEIGSGSENRVDHYSRWQAGEITEDELREYRYEVINDNGDPNVIDPKGFQFKGLDAAIEFGVLPIKKRLERRGERLFVNLNFVDFGGGRGASTNRHNDQPEEYGEFMLATFRHISSKFGFVPDAIEVILEPDNGTGWTGTQIGHAIVETAKRLNAEGFHPKFIAPSTTNAANAPVFIDAINDVPGAMEHVTEFSYHRYCCASSEVLTAIADRAAKHGKQTAMLEWIGADQETIHQDLTVANNSAWEQYSLCSLSRWGPDQGEGLIRVNDSDPENPVVTISDSAKFLRHYFKHVRSGAVRIGATTSNPHMDVVGFINANGSYVAVVKALASGAVEIRGLPAGKYSHAYTTAASDGYTSPVQEVAEGAAYVANISAAGVITIYQVPGGSI